MRRVDVETVTEITTAYKRRKIRLQPVAWFQAKGVSVPSFIWQEPSYFFEPTSFVPSAEGLDKRPFSANIQWESLHRFEKDPSKPCTYIVASEPNDGKALYFAAYLVQLFLSTVPGLPNVVWERMYGGFRNRNYEARQAELLVLSNVSVTDTNSKLEYVRDVLDIHEDIPKIVVVSGMDPVSFASARIHHRMTHMFFMSASIVKRTISVE